MINSIRAISANFGFPLAEKSTGRNISVKREMLSHWSKEGSEDKARRVDEALCNTVEYAAKYVPYYNNLFRRMRFDPSKMRSDIKYFQDIPHLTKETILATPEEFISSQFKHDQLIERKTSGSSGLTLGFYYTQDELDWTTAVIFHLNSLIPHTLSDREVRLKFESSATGGVGARGRIYERFRGLAMNRFTVSMQSLTDTTVESYINAIRKQKPNLIYGLPSSIKALIAFAKSENDYKGLTKYYLATGETLDTHSAKHIAESIGCKIVNRYGNAEFGAIAQSSAGTEVLDVVDGLVFPENFGAKGFSEIVLTTLVNRGMPLIRYRTGDLGSIGKGKSGGYCISSIQGRLHDLLEINGKTYTTSYLSEFLHGRFTIHDFQIVKKGDAMPVINVVTDQPGQIDEIKNSIKTLLGVELDVARIRPTDLIRKGSQLKFMHYVRQ